MSGAARLEGRALACTRGERRLFAGLDLAVGPGECVHVAGDNGAGKTSLLRLLAGLLAPTQGSVHWQGVDIAAGREEFAAALAFVGHLNGIKDDLTALENVRFEARLRGGDGSLDAGLEALERLGMLDHADAPTRRLSQGQKRRVALARLCQRVRAPLWILDEPFNALDAQSVEVLGSLLAAHLAAGGLAVLTAHQDIPLPVGARRLLLGGAGS